MTIFFHLYYILNYNIQKEQNIKSITETAPFKYSNFRDINLYVEETFNIYCQYASV